MALSGVYSLELTAAEVIIQALEELQATGQGEDVDGEIAESAKVTINRLLKLWQTQGNHLWTRKEYTMFFQVGQRIYDFTDESTRVVDGESWSSTTLSEGAVVSSFEYEVTDTSEIALGYAIAAINEENNLEWSVVNRIDSGIVYLNDALTVACNAGSIVRFYPTADLVNTTIATAYAGGNDIVVASTEDFEAGMTIQVTLDDLTVGVTTINSIDEDADTITINDELNDTAAIGNSVVAYSSVQNYTPIARIANAEDTTRRHGGENTDYEIPITLIDRGQYMTLPTKEQLGTVIQAYYDRQEPAGKFYLWNSPYSSLEYLNFTAERKLQIIDDVDDTFDLPEEWTEALVMNVAKKLIPKVGCSPQRVAFITAEAQSTLDSTLAFDSDIYPIEVDPKLDQNG